LKQLLFADLAANKKDGGIAEQLNSIQLSEQLTGATLDGWMKELKAGPKTAAAAPEMSSFGTSLYQQISGFGISRFNCFI
jgi:hypothetical protein